MKNKLVKVCTAFVFMGLVAANANATSIWLEPNQSSYMVGDTVSVSVMVDSTDQSILAGGLDIFISNLGSVIGNAGFAFDSAFLGPIADPAFSRAPDDCSTNMSASGCGGANELNGLGFGNFGGISGNYLVGVLTFDALAAGVAALTMADNDVPAGSWFDVNSNPMTIAYTGAEIHVVPLPAAVWLMLGGLGMLLGFGKKRRDLKMAAI